MKKLVFLLILPILVVLFFSGCYYPTTLVYETPERTFAPPPQTQTPTVSLEQIYFNFNKADITPEAKAVLKKNAEWISKHPTAKIQIVGNCDGRGTNEYNKALGKRRANAAKEYLVNRGIAAGKEKPLDPEQNENAWAQNRRVDFNVVGDTSGEQSKPPEEMAYGYPYPYDYYPYYPYYYPSWGYYSPWWGYPYSAA